MDSNKDEPSSNSSSQSECSWNYSNFSTESALDSGAFGTDAKVNGYQYRKDRYKLTKLLPMHIDEIRNEITLLHKMNHPNIVRCYTSWEEFDANCNNMYYFIQMELCARDLR